MRESACRRRARSRDSFPPDAGTFDSRTSRELRSHGTRETMFLKRSSSALRKKSPDRCTLPGQRNASTEDEVFRATASRNAPFPDSSRSCDEAVRARSIAPRSKGGLNAVRLIRRSSAGIETIADTRNRKDHFGMVSVVFQTIAKPAHIYPEVFRLLRVLRAPNRA